MSEDVRQHGSELRSRPRVNLERSIRRRQVATGLAMPPRLLSPAFVYHFIMGVLVFASFIVTVVAARASVSERGAKALEYTLALLLTNELCVRLITCGSLNEERFMGWKGRLRFLGQWVEAIDLVIWFLSVLQAALLLDHRYSLSSAAFNFARLIPFARLIRFERYILSGPLLLLTIRKSIREIIGALFVILFMIVILGATGYALEHDAQPLEFTSLSSGIYWATISIATVGYGDIVPVTPGGRALSCIFVVLSSLFYGIPVGIIGTTYALNVENHRIAQKKHQRRCTLAACLIQLAWRRHQLNSSCVNGTWRFFGVSCVSRPLVLWLVRVRVRQARNASAGERGPARTIDLEDLYREMLRIDRDANARHNVLVTALHTAEQNMKLRAERMEQLVDRLCELQFVCPAQSNDVQESLL